MARTYRARTLNLFSDAPARHALSIQDVLKVNNQTHVPTLEHYHNITVQVSFVYDICTHCVRFFVMILCLVVNPYRLFQMDNHPCSQHNL